MAVRTRLLIAESAATPEMEISPEMIMSNTGVLSSSLDGNEVAVDVAEPTLKNMKLFVPADADSFLAAGETLYVGGDPRNMTSIPYGTEVEWYEGDAFIGKFYVESVGRVGKNLWQLHLISALGLLDNVDHAGGIYTGRMFPQVLAEIIGDTFNYELSSEIEVWKVYGWLPYDTARNNLHRLLLAYGVNIGKTAEGLPYFDVLPFGETVTVPNDIIYMDGSVSYRAPATAVAVTEHTYWQPAAAQPEELFSNIDGSGTMDGSRIIFSEPVYDLSASSGLTINESGVNYAVLTGVGTLTGKKYAHLQKVVRASSGDSALKPREISVTNDTLIGPMNSWNVAQRLLDYYTATKTVSGAMVLEDGTIKPGVPISATDVFGDTNTAVVSRMEITSSATVKAGFEAVEGFTPGHTGPTFKTRGSWISSGTYTIPKSSRYRFILIGGGQGGQGGMDGEAGHGRSKTYGGDMTYYSDTYQVSYVYDGGQSTGGAGGIGGQPGSAGKVLTFDVYLEAGMSVARTVGSGGTGGTSNGGLGALGGDTTITVYDQNGVPILTRSSAEGVVPPDGVYEVLSDVTYAIPGTAGIRGGDGGKTTAFTDWGWGWDGDGWDGEAAPLAAGVQGGSVGDYYGGSGGAGYYDEQWDAMPQRIYQFTGGGGGGGGGAYGASGGAGRNASPDDTDPWILRMVTGGSGGTGANAASPAVPSYGGGGNGGHGGGGGGNGGGARIWDERSHFSVGSYNVIAGNPGTGGNGSAGSRGGNGLVVFYYGSSD